MKKCILIMYCKDGVYSRREREGAAYYKSALEITPPCGCRKRGATWRLSMWAVVNVVSVEVATVNVVSIEVASADMVAFDVMSVDVAAFDVAADNMVAVDAVSCPLVLALPGPTPPTLLSWLPLRHRHRC